MNGSMGGFYLETENKDGEKRNYLFEVSTFVSLAKVKGKVHTCTETEALGFPSGPFPSGFPTITVYAPLLSPMPHPSHSSRFYDSNNIW